MGLEMGLVRRFWGWMEVGWEVVNGSELQK